MRQHGNARAPALLLALCLGLAGCGEGLGSEPVVVSGSSPSYTDDTGSAAGKEFAALAGAETTEAGTVYLDVTEEMYATGRYGEKPDGTGCISAAEAADLAAQYAPAFVDYGLEDGIWKLNLAADEEFFPGIVLWHCTMSLPKWSETPSVIPDEPVVQGLSPEQLARLDEQYHSIYFLLDGAAGELVSGYASLPDEGLVDLVMGGHLPPETLQAYEDARLAWCAEPEAQAIVTGAFERLTGLSASRAELSKGGRSYEVWSDGGSHYTVQPHYPTGLLASCRWQEGPKGGPAS